MTALFLSQPYTAKKIDKFHRWLAQQMLAGRRIVDAKASRYGCTTFAAPPTTAHQEVA